MADPSTTVRMDVSVNGFHQSPVAKAFDELAEQVTQLQDEVNVLIDRMSTGLGPAYPQDIGVNQTSEGADPSRPSEVVIALNRETSRIKDQVELIRYTATRIEL